MDKENSGITLSVPKPRNPTRTRGFKWTDGADQDFLKDFFS